MNKITELKITQLREKGWGYAKIGKILGCTAGAVQQSIVAKRDIRVELNSSGKAIKWREIKCPDRGVNTPESQKHE